MAFLVSSMLWFFLMVIFWYLLPLSVYKREHTFKDHFRANFGTSEFLIENDRGERSWDWNSFSTWIESPHFFHLYFNTRAFFLVPKDAFDEAGVQAARQILTEKIKKA